MASNKLPTSVAELLDLGTHCRQGLVAHGASLNILQYTPTNYGAKVDALTAKQLSFNAERSAFAAAYGPLHAQLGLLRKAGLDARKLFSITLGDEWSPAWTAAGWPDQTTQVPENLVGLKTLAGAIAAFLSGHEDFQVDTPKITFTPERYTALLTGLAPLELALDNHRTALGNARTAREADEKALRTATRGLIALLDTLLPPDSALWDAFGLNRPGASVTPAAPGLPVLTKVPGGHVLGNVAPVATAKYYRWFTKVEGVDPEFRFDGRTQDPVKEIDDLPATGVLRVKVQAANEAGPGKASPVATVNLGA